MASFLRELARRSPANIVKSPSPAAWETTAKLRNQYFATSMEAMPERVAEASKEWAQLRKKVVSRDFTLNEVGVGVVRAAEIYAFYLVGRVIGSRSLST